MCSVVIFSLCILCNVRGSCALCVHGCCHWLPGKVSKDFPAHNHTPSGNNNNSNINNNSQKVKNKEKVNVT